MIQHTFNRIRAHTYWLSPDTTTDRPVLGVIAGNHRTLLVDAGNSPAHAQVLLHEVSESDIAPPQFVALTHWHWDHVFGTAALDLPTFGHIETRRIVSEMADLDWSDTALDRRVEAGIEIDFCRDMIKAELPDRTGLTIRPPDISFTDRIELDLGGVTCQIEHVGGDHAADSTIVFVPEDKIAFLGDCLYVDIYHTPRRYTTKKLFPLLDRLLSLDADYYLHGHHPHPMSRAEMIEEAALLTTIGRAVERRGQDREAILADLRQTISAPLDDDHRELVDEFLAGISPADQPFQGH